MVVTNLGYTRPALALARPNSVVMCDRNKLSEMLTKSRRDESGAKPLSAASGSAPARCYQCGEEVSEGVRAYCVDKSERFGGRILCMRHQRSAHEPRLRRSA
jgi:hypothetical protein